MAGGAIAAFSPLPSGTETSTVVTRVSSSAALTIPVGSPQLPFLPGVVILRVLKQKTQRVLSRYKVISVSTKIPGFYKTLTRIFIY